MRCIRLREWSISLRPRGREWECKAVTISSSKEDMVSSSRRMVVSMAVGRARIIMGSRDNKAMGSKATSNKATARASRVMDSTDSNMVGKVIITTAETHTLGGNERGHAGESLR